MDIYILKQLESVMHMSEQYSYNQPKVVPEPEIQATRSQKWQWEGFDSLELLALWDVEEIWWLYQRCSSLGWIATSWPYVFPRFIHIDTTENSHVNAMLVFRLPYIQLHTIKIVNTGIKIIHMKYEWGKYSFTTVCVVRIFPDLS